MLAAAAAVMALLCCSSCAAAATELQEEVAPVVVVQLSDLHLAATDVGTASRAEHLLQLGDLMQEHIRPDVLLITGEFSCAWPYAPQAQSWVRLKVCSNREVLAIDACLLCRRLH